MYNKLLPSKKDCTNEFLLGVMRFVVFASKQEVFSREDVIRCLCLKCKNWKYMNLEDVKVYIYSRGFMLRYWFWSCHDEEDCTTYGDCNFGSFTHEDNFKAANQFQNMIFDVASLSCINYYNYSFEESLNEDTKFFYNMLNFT